MNKYNRSVQPNQLTRVCGAATILYDTVRRSDVRARVVSFASYRRVSPIEKTEQSSISVVICISIRLDVRYLCDYEWCSALVSLGSYGDHRNANVNRTES
jgi:hypothetical protein